jgi:hypothetical protein
VRRVLLVTGQHMPNPVAALKELVVNMKHLAARIPENRIHTLFNKRLNKNSRPGILHKTTILTMMAAMVKRARCLTAIPISKLKLSVLKLR